MRWQRERVKGRARGQRNETHQRLPWYVQNHSLVDLNVYVCMRMVMPANAPLSLSPLQRCQPLRLSIAAIPRSCLPRLACARARAHRRLARWHGLPQMLIVPLCGTLSNHSVQRLSPMFGCPAGSDRFLITSASLHNGSAVSYRS
jgi:hypothetical protein